MMATTVVSGLSTGPSSVASILRSASDVAADEHSGLGPDDVKLPADRPPRTFYEVLMRDTEFSAIVAKLRTIEVRLPIGQFADV